MTKQAYEELITALDERGIGVVHHKYTWNTFGTWEIVADTTPRRRILWSGHLAQLKIEHTVDGDPEAFRHYRLHWEGPEGYSPRTEAVIDALVSESNPRREAFEEARQREIDDLQQRLGDQLDEVPAFGGDGENPARRIFLLGWHFNGFNFKERQLAKVGDLVGAMRSFEMRSFRFGLITWLLAGFWIERIGFTMSMFSFLALLYLLHRLIIWLDARATRVGLERLAAEKSPAPEPQAQPSP